LRPSDRDEPRGGTEQKTFHHLHLNLHMLSWEDRSPSGAAHPGSSPSPLPVRPFPCPFFVPWAPV
jgi:hypothetical protein